MAIAFACPKCGCQMNVDDSLAGRQGKCPKCSQAVVVPQPAQVQAPPAEEVCSSCGVQLSPGAVICVQCGTDQRTGEKTVATPGDQEGGPAEGGEGRSAMSVPGDPDIPKSVRFYGTVIMMLSVVEMLACLGGGIAGAASSGEIPPAIMGLGGCIIPYILYRFGKGLRDGERSAVYALCVFTVLAFIGFAATSFLTLTGAGTGDEVLLAVGFIICGGNFFLIFLPPTIVSLRNLSRFH